MDTVGRFPTPLCGLSHGASGLGWALLELGAVTGDDRFSNAACEALRYERSWFDDRAGIWPDLREMAPGEQLAGAPFWCHGAGGIGLVRLRAYQLAGDAGECLGLPRCRLRPGSVADGALRLRSRRAPGGGAATRNADARPGGRSCDGPFCRHAHGRTVSWTHARHGGVGMAFLRLAVPDRVPSVGLFPIA